MEYINVCEACTPCETVCEAEGKCRITPCPKMYVDPCKPCDTGVFLSPMCNEDLFSAGESKCDYLFCENGRKF